MPSPAEGRVESIRVAACEAGWPGHVTDSGDVQVDLDSRAGTFVATLQVHGSAPDQWVVELMDIAGTSATSQCATAALLRTLPRAVRSVTGLIMTRHGAALAALVAPLGDVSTESLDLSLTALTIGCDLVGREVHALRDEQLAADFVALFGIREPEPHTIEEEDPCLQQLSLISASK